VSSSTRPGISRSTRVPAPPASSTVEAARATPLENILREMRIRNSGSRGSLIGASVESAWEAVLTNRTRSLLTMLGIVIGVAAVIGSLTLAQGVGAFIDQIIAGLGSNVVLIDGSPNNNVRGPVIRRGHSSLTMHDYQALGKLPHVAAISPMVQTQAQVVYRNQNWRTRIIGVSTDLQTIQDWQLAQGMWFTSADAGEGIPVAVVGDTVVQKLFPIGSNPIGQKIRVRDQIFRVVGVLAPKGGGGFGASDDSILVPYSTALTRLTNQTYIPDIILQADSKDTVALVSQEVTTALLQSHRLPRGQPNDFSMITSAQLMQQADQETQAIALLLGGIAAISLTVGGIGIMNIMLVSVTERTREIGVRMSIGARRRDIRNQFLIEALFLCLLGGIIGMLLGIFIGWLMVGVILSALASGGPGGGQAAISVPLIITPTTLILPFVVSVTIGIVFGLYPAIRASRLDPIVALRRAK
jgi:putative ABC transport system permease protein